MHRERLLTECGRSIDECWAGIGEPRKSLADIRLSYVEAQRAADIARMVEALGSVVYHCDLGAFGLLAELPPDRLRRSLHPGLASLLEYEDGKNDSLVSTLKALLDNAGDVKRTVEQLHLHRGSMYNRLHRVQEITGTDLGHGNDRLAVHLGLKVARLLDPRRT